MRLPFDQLRRDFEAAGITCVGNPEGPTRGREFTTIRAIILHDTVTTRSWTAANVWKLLSHGRAGLPGPLANLSPDRSGLLWLVADGVANHNGYGRFGNQTVGIEVQCAGGLKGYEEPWNDAQHDTVERACWVLERHWDVPILGHRESDPNRKIDPFRVDLDAVRRAIFTQPEEIDDMANYADQLNAIQAELRLNGVRLQQVRDRNNAVLRAVRAVVQAAVIDAFQTRGLTIGTATESAAMRVTRITAELESGAKTWTGLMATLDAFASEDGPTQDAA